MKEQELVNQIIDYLAYQKECFVWRQNQGAFKTETGGFYKFSSIKGISDIIGCYKGKFLAIECKVGRNKPSEAQIDFMNRISKLGGVSILAYSLNDVTEALKNL